MDNIRRSHVSSVGFVHKEDFSNPLEADHIGINSEFFE